MSEEMMLDRIKEELEVMEADIINERKQREQQGNTFLSYKLYERKVEERKKKEAVLSYEERKQVYIERLEDIVNQHQINIEDTLDKMLCIVAIKAIHNAKRLQYELEVI